MRASPCLIQMSHDLTFEPAVAEATNVISIDVNSRLIGSAPDEPTNV